MYPFLGWDPLRVPYGSQRGTRRVQYVYSKGSVRAQGF